MEQLIVGLLILVVILIFVVIYQSNKADTYKQLMERALEDYNGLLSKVMASRFNKH